MAVTHLPDDSVVRSLFSEDLPLPTARANLRRRGYRPGLSLTKTTGSQPVTEFHEIWIEQCEAAENIEAEFGTQRAMDYLVGEKCLDFL